MLIQSLVLFTKHSLALLYEEIMSLNRSFFVYFFDIYTFLEIVLLLFSKCFEFSNLFNSVSFENLLEVIMSYYYVVFVDKVFIRFVFVFTVMMLVPGIFIFILHLFVVFGVVEVPEKVFRSGCGGFLGCGASEKVFRSSCGFCGSCDGIGNGFPE